MSKAKRMSLRWLRLLWLGGRLRLNFWQMLPVDGVDALAGFLRKRRVRILGQHIVVINLRALPLVTPLIVARNLVAAAGLFGFEHVNFILRFGHTFVRGVQRGEIGEGGDGLG